MSKENRSNRPVKTPMVGLVTMVVVVVGLMVDVSRAENDNFYLDIMRLEAVATKIHQSYVEDVGSSELIDKGINGMMGVLDPHTAFFQEKQYEDLRISTEGKFGGLGIQIAIREKVLTVMTPISGTPAYRAGIQSGDQILKIDGKSTKGITIDAAVGKLRGVPGTNVTITIRRRGEARDLDYDISREIITIKSVPFYGLMPGNIGYLRLLTFSQDAGAETEKALKVLLQNKLEGLILDLRHNPGGLLPQANEVAEKFLEKKSLVVSTRGRARGQNKEFYAAGNPVLPREIPLVVLVSDASASASEIVAGAIQDWDRGLVVGDTTFGKGSVQTILPVDKEHHLKLTTAYYYTPSGRCINRPEYAAGWKKAEDGESPLGDEDVDDDGEQEDAAEPDSAQKGPVRDTTVYRTKGGRIVYAGGGIVPDSVVKPSLFSPVIRSLYMKDAFFEFANHMYPRLKQRKIVFDSSFVVSPDMMKDFRHYLDSTGFVFENRFSVKYDELKKIIGIADADTAKPQDIDTLLLSKQDNEALHRALREIGLIISREADSALVAHRDEVKDRIREAFLVRVNGQDHETVYRNRLSQDVQYQAALAILRNKDTYNRILNPSVSKK